MKALVYHGAYNVVVEDKPMPTIKDPEDAIIRVTSTAICGSDLHLFHGMLPSMIPGQTLGHEFMGIVQEVGPEVRNLKPGDRVVVPFNVFCGRCWYCQHEHWSVCERSGAYGGAYGYGSEMGGYDGGQSEYVRVPYADHDPLKVPEHLSDEQVLFLSDIFPTGYFGADMASILPGDDVAVFGAGPVGYFAVVSAFLKGAGRVFCVDHWPDRLEKVKELGAIPINFDHQDPVKTIKDATEDRGAVCIDAVGFEALRAQKKADKSQPNRPTKQEQVLVWISEAARKFSTVGIVGVYGMSINKFPMGTLFNRGVNLKMGQCPVRKYDHYLLGVIQEGKVDPTRIISHTMKLDEGPEAYKIFNEKDATKIVLKP